FIKIFSSNLEEFFQVRVGSLISDEEDGDETIDSKSGMTSLEQLETIYSFIPALMEKKDRAFVQIDHELRREGLIRVNISELNREELVTAIEFYRDEVVPNIEPHVIREKDDFPHIESNKSYIISRLASANESVYVLVDISEAVPPVCVIKESKTVGDKVKYIVTDDLVKALVPQSYKPFDDAETFCFAITRNGDIKAEKNSEEMVDEMKEIIEKRRYSDPDKLIVDTKISREAEDFMLEAFDLLKEQVAVTSRISYSYVDELKDLMNDSMKAKLCYPPFTPNNQLKLINKPLMEHIKKEDLLSSYPFDSMDPLLQLLKEASESKNVREIRMTIYRLSSHPIIVEHLLNAVNNGIKVKLLIEIRARFDESKNIDWVEKLSKAGCKIYIGDEKYKVHSKLCQIVLEEKGKKKYITQVSTGNYNEKSAKLYTDFSLITYNQNIGEDVNEFFGDVFKHKEGKYEHVLASPKNMQDVIISLIRREARKGSKGKIFIKVNSVTDEEIIEELMEASCAGCMVRMIVRGICCILPGVRDCTENIRVVNVVGRFLEHSRVYIFGEGDDEEMYISSADLMTRNMKKRVELACPIYDLSIRERIKAVLFLNYADNVKGRIMRSDGTYAKKAASGRSIDSQDLLMKQH
ncbi:MAG: polyphosphate kinase 1, partial [Mogibacterium sp.]|nr:polyphosphate kinase 1 [Mogibacterium sp.]